MARRTQRRKRGFATRAVHAGQHPDPTTGAVAPPLYLTSTYRRPALDGDWPYGYGRVVNPTRSALERNLADLEGGREARCFASGMAAIAAALHLVRPGDHVVVSENAYGGTHRLFEGLLRDTGLDFTWVDTSSIEAVQDALRPSTRMLFVETPSNPTLRLTDLAAIGALARRRRLRLVVDNTFATPYLQQPLRFGAHVVVHSTTKYLNGHSDGIGGCVVCARAADAERIATVQRTAGAVMSPLDAYLVLRGVKTLPLRMERHTATAGAIAQWLDARRKVSRVFYPGLASHPQVRLARAQMSGAGGVVTFDLGKRSAARRFVKALRVCTLAESLGGVESLISHPATMTHHSFSAAERKRLGVTDGLLRLSVGVEDPEDLIDDLGRGLRSV